MLRGGEVGKLLEIHIQEELEELHVERLEALGQLHQRGTKRVAVPGRRGRQIQVRRLLQQLGD